MNDLKMNTEQKKIHDYIIHSWIKNSDPFIIIGGYAGTGKTYLLTEIAKSIREILPQSYFSFCSFTGKAVSVLSSRLKNIKQFLKLTSEKDTISTIHSMIYKPIIEKNPLTGKSEVVGWEKTKKLINNPDFIFIDESSMVSLDIWEDLLSFGVKIIAMGDTFQLPPIGSEKFNLMKLRKFNLTEIHRQAKQSPIINLSMIIRKEGYIPLKTYSSSVFKHSWNNKKCQEFYNSIDLKKPNNIVLCGFNKTRCFLNNQFRSKIKFKKDVIYSGDKVICLKNNPTTKIKNGQQGIIMWVMSYNNIYYKTSIDLDGLNEFYDGLISKSSFGKPTFDEFCNKPNNRNQNIDYFDFSYAISVHKAQASEWDNVILFEQRSKYWDDKYFAKWLYTAVTRAKKGLFVISDFWG